MKIRTDFVTNSSSSSFMVTIYVECKSGQRAKWNSGWYCWEDRGPLFVSLSPKKLLKCDTIAELTEMLAEKISAPIGRSSFIKEIKELPAVETIRSAKITAYESYGEYSRSGSYTYDAVTGRYTALLDGCSFESEGSGGEFEIPDFSDCSIDFSDGGACECKLTIYRDNNHMVSWKVAPPESSYFYVDRHKVLSIAHSPRQLMECENISQFIEMLSETFLVNGIPQIPPQYVTENLSKFYNIDDISVIVLELCFSGGGDLGVPNGKSFEGTQNWAYIKGSPYYLTSYNGYRVYLGNPPCVVFGFTDFTEKMYKTSYSFYRIIENICKNEKRDSTGDWLPKVFSNCSLEINPGLIQWPNSRVEYVDDCLYCNNTYYMYKNANKVEISDNVICIENSAFTNAYELESITIPASVKKIQESSFGNCKKLCSITVDSKSPYYFVQDGCLIEKATGMLIYCLCKNQKEITVPDCVKVIGRDVFRSSVAEKIIITSDCISVHDYAFCGAKELCEIVGFEKIISFGTSSFEDCEKLRIGEFNTAVIIIPESCFQNCFSLQEVHLPNKLREVKSHAFYNCTSLRNVYMSSLVEKMPLTAFGKCTDITLTAPEESFAQTFAKRAKINFVASGEIDPNKQLKTYMQNFEGKIASRGRTLYKSGAVKKLDKQPNRYVATVQGSELYTVCYRYDKDIVMQCTCPFAAGGNKCKHMYAVLMAICDENM